MTNTKPATARRLSRRDDNAARRVAVIARLARQSDAELDELIASGSITLRMADDARAAR